MSKNINIQMKQFNGVDYDDIYPSVPSNIVKSSEFLNGIIPSNNIDEAFEKVFLASRNLAKLTLTIKTEDGVLISNVTMDGVTDRDGNPVYSNSNGVLSGYIEAKDKNYVLNYADLLNSGSLYINAIAGEEYIRDRIVKRTNFARITVSKNIRFTDNVDFIDFSIGGAGGGGGGGNEYAGGGGGGGESKIATNIRIVPNQEYPVIIGDGGKGGTGHSTAPVNGLDGGNSSFLGVEVNGGKGGTSGNLDKGGIGGTGNGNGGNAKANGTNGTQQFYTSFTNTSLYGGGGGGGSETSIRFKGGSPAGKQGGIEDGNGLGSGGSASVYLGGGWRRRRSFSF